MISKLIKNWLVNSGVYKPIVKLKLKCKNYSSSSFFSYFFTNKQLHSHHSLLHASQNKKICMELWMLQIMHSQTRINSLRTNNKTMFIDLHLYSFALIPKEHSQACAPSLLITLHLNLMRQTPLTLIRLAQWLVRVFRAPHSI